MSGQAVGVKKSRLGRPMVQDHLLPTSTNMDARKQRIRLAQRNYRLKKELELNAAREKAENAESRAAMIIESFTKFNDDVTSLGKAGHLSLEVMMALSRTALEIANLSNGASRGGVEREGDKRLQRCQDENEEQGVTTRTSTPPISVRPSKSPQVSDASHKKDTAHLSSPSNTRQAPSISSIPPQPPYPLLPYTQAHTNLSFDLRLRLACLEKAVRLLSSPIHSISQIHPVLSLHLKWLPAQQLLLLNQESLCRFPNLNVYGPDPHPALPSPDLYRKVEGQKSVIQRRFGRDVETLARGLTRTMVCTDMPGFEGEWMEARDVMEYLEEKGVNFGVPEVFYSPPCIPFGWFSTPLVDVGGEKFICPPLNTGFQPISTARSISNLNPTVEVLRPKFKAFVNPQFLVEYLGMTSCCIGPAPAVRKDDVDRALMLSITGA